MIERDPKGEGRKTVRKYDAIIVGSSPICLIEAVSLGLTGQKVLIVERNDRLGGAWSTIDFPGFPNLNRAPRIIERNRNSYGFMRDFLGWSMQEMSPQPQTVLKHFSVPVPYGSLIDHLIGAAIYYQRTFLPRCFNLIRLMVTRVLISYTAFNESAGTSTRIVSEIQYLNNNAFPRLYRLLLTIGSGIKSTVLRKGYPSFQFPEGGTSEMIGKLSAMLEEAGVTVELSTSVDAIFVDVETGEAAVKLPGGWVNSEQVIITSGANIDEIVTPSGKVAVPREEREFSQVYLIVEASTTRNAAFVHCPQSSLIRRLGCFSIDGQSAEAGLSIHKLIVVLVDNDLPSASENGSIVARLMIELKIMGIVDKKAEPVTYFFSDYRTSSRNSEAEEALQKQFGPALRVLQTGNLTNAVAGNMTRWAASMKMKV